MNNRFKQVSMAVLSALVLVSCGVLLLGRQASAAGIPCSSLWAAISAATATAPSRP